jgi:uncharacterized Ntn-hydrolase superfamily protein
VLAALAPGKGAAAVQADFVLQNRDRVFDLLLEGLPADSIVEMMTTNSDDTNLGLRQYGVVTFDDSTVQAAGFTGEANFNWASDRQDPGLAVSVQGNSLESEEVINSTLAAFSAGDLGPVVLSDRLIRALEAGSASGGDKRCNSDVVEQTAQSAFIAVARADEEPFAAPFTLSAELEGVDLPWIYFAVIEARGGPNPIIDLRRQYDLWRADNIPPCPDCDLRPIGIPPGRQTQSDNSVAPTSAPATKEVVVEATAPLPSPPDPSPFPSYTGTEGYPADRSANGLDPLPSLVIVVAIALLVALSVLWSRRRQARKAPGS